MAEYTLFCSAHLLASREKVFSPGGLLVSGGNIVLAGELRRLSRFAPSGTRRIDFPESVILPGFINAHTHLCIPPLTEREGGDFVGGDFVGWLQRVIEWRRSVSDDELAKQVRESSLQCQRSGITAVGDISYEYVPLYEKIGLRIRSYLELLGMTEEVLKERKEGLEKELDLFEKGGEMIRPGVSPHSLYTCSREGLRWAGRVSEERDIPLQLHLGESLHEMDFIRKGAGEILDRVYRNYSISTGKFSGYKETVTDLVREVLPPGSALVHGTFLSEEEIGRFVIHGYHFIFCTRSNRFLTGSIPPLQMVVDGGYPFALGTDSRASCGTIDMFEEMRSFVDGYHGSYRSEELYGRVIEGATMGGAEIIGYDDICGTLSEGKKADFFVFEIGKKERKIVKTLIEKGEQTSIVGTYVSGHPITDCEHHRGRL